MINIAFLASHNGSSAKAIAMACKTGVLPAYPALLISNNENSKAILWAQEESLNTAVLNAKNCDDVDGMISQKFKENNIGLVVCSGYMKLAGEKTIDAVMGKILNVHPALLPLYGGRGMYGRRVHQAVFDNKDKQTGVTIHWVDGKYDHGEILAQKIIPLNSDDTVDSIEEKVKLAETDFYIDVLKNLLKK